MDYALLMAVLKCLGQVVLCLSIITTSFFYFCPQFIIPMMVKFGLMISSVQQRRISFGNGLWARYLEYGDRDKCTESLLFIHGFSGSAVDFLGYVKHLAGKHVVFMNMMNHGGNITFDKDITMAEMVDYVDEFVQWSGLSHRKFHIVGFSMGGGLAVQYVAKNPKEVQSLFLINPYGFYDQSKNPMFTERDGDMTYETNEEFLAMYEKMSSGTMPLPWWLVTPLRYHKNNTAPMEVCVMRGQRKSPSLFDKSFLEPLVAHSVPVKYVQGEIDCVTPKEGLDYFLSHVPHASHSVIEGGAHFLPYTHVEKICTSINEWVGCNALSSSS